MTPQAIDRFLAEWFVGQEGFELVVGTGNPHHDWEALEMGVEQGSPLLREDIPTLEIEKRWYPLFAPIECIFLLFLKSPTFIGMWWERGKGLQKID